MRRRPYRFCKYELYAAYAANPMHSIVWRIGYANLFHKIRRDNRAGVKQYIRQPNLAPTLCDTRLDKGQSINYVDFHTAARIPSQRRSYTSRVSRLV